MKEARESFLAVAASGNRDASLAAVADQLALGLAPAALIQQLFVPVLREAGARWATNRWTAAQGSLCADAVEAALVLVDAARRPGAARGGRVVVACAEGERHSLPARLLASEMAFGGCQAVFLGAGIDGPALRAFLGTHRPDAVLVSCTLTEHLQGAARTLATARDMNLPVIVGGPAFGRDESVARRLGADGWATTARGALRLLSGPEGPLRVDPPLDALVDAVREGERLEAAAPLLGEIAAAAVGSLEGAEQPRSRAAEATRLLRTAAAALHVGDQRIMSEYLDWAADWRAAWGSSWHELYQLLVAGDAATVGGFPLASSLLRAEIDGLRSRHTTTPSSVPSIRPGGGRPLPRPANEKARLAALAAHGQPDDPPDRQLISLIELAATVCDTPIAYLGFIDEHTQHLVAARGLEIRSLPREQAVCAATILQTDVVIIPDLAAHPDFAATPMVAAEPGWRFYAAAPIVVGRNLAIGTLAVVDYEPRTLSSTQYRALADLAGHVVDRLDLLRRPASVGNDPRPAAERLLAGLIDLRDGRTDGGLLSTRDVARVFQVSARTVANWATSGRLATVQTAGGHYRFDPEDVARLLLDSHDPRGSSRTEEARP